MMRGKIVSRIAVVAAVFILAADGVGASTEPASYKHAGRDVTSPPAVPRNVGPPRSTAPQGLLQPARLECLDTGLGGSCPTLQHCLNSCVVIFDVEMALCFAVGAPWIGQCIINASDRWAQCRRDCTSDYPA